MVLPAEIEIDSPPGSFLSHALSSNDIAGSFNDLTLKILRLARAERDAAFRLFDERGRGILVRPESPARGRREQEQCACEERFGGI